MYRQMLVPLDGSSLAETVLEYATELAGRLNVNITLLHVCETEENKTTRIHRHYIEHSAELVADRLRKVQKETAAGQKAGEQDVQGKVAFGQPAEGILRYVEQNNIDIIIMATHGRSGITRWALGSVADKVLRASPVPVCLLRAAAPENAPSVNWPMKSILVPLDTSEMAESVLPHVEALARQRGSEQMEIVLLSVCEPLLLPSYYPLDMPLSWNDHIARCKRINKEYLEKVEKRLNKPGLAVRVNVEAGNPAGEIIKYSQNNPVDIVVMATHGRSGPSRLLMGSVAQKILLGISKPLVLVRPEDKSTD